MLFSENYMQKRFPPELQERVRAAHIKDQHDYGELEYYDPQLYKDLEKYTSDYRVEDILDRMKSPTILDEIFEGQDLTKEEQTAAFEQFAPQWNQAVGILDQLFGSSGPVAAMRNMLADAAAASQEQGDPAIMHSGMEQAFMSFQESMATFPAAPPVPESSEEELALIQQYQAQAAQQEALYGKALQLFHEINDREELIAAAGSEPVLLASDFWEYVARYIEDVLEHSGMRAEDTHMQLMMQKLKWLQAES